MSTTFEPGAPPSAGFVPLSVPEVRGNEWSYIKECLDTGWVSSVGSFVDRFEEEFARIVGARHAIAAVNGTAALHIGLLLAGVQPGDEVLVSNLTFIASANAAKYSGAIPVFIDAESDYWQMDPKKLSAFLEANCTVRDGGCYNRLTNRRISAILPVHILGHSVDLDAIQALADKYGIPIVEDAAEALGTQYKGRPIGASGNICCFSFNGNKLITTGGGGMIVCNDETTAKRAKYLTTQAKDDPREYIHNETGYNYRLTNILAAMGCAQLEQLEGYIARKLEIAAKYERALSQARGLTPMPCAEWCRSTRWLYTILVDEAQYGESSRALMQRLQESKIESRPLWQPMHQSPALAGCLATPCEVSESLAAQALSLPCSVGLTEADQDRVISALLR